jgi:hypothetical protein
LICGSCSRSCARRIAEASRRTHRAAALSRQRALSRR